MKLDFSTAVNGLDGRPVKRNTGSQEAPVLVDWTLGGLAADALLAPVQGSAGPTVDSVSTRWALALKVNAGGEQDITPQEASMIQEAVARSFPVGVAGPVIALLNGN